MSAVKVRILDGFDDPTFGPDQWQRLLTASNTDIVYLTWHFQRTWWELHARGELLLILAERDGQPLALGSFYVESEMLYFVGTGFESGRLDFIGDIGHPEILDSILEAARAHVPGLLGFRFHFVPDTSDTGRRLHEAAGRLGLTCYEEEYVDSPVLDLAGRAEMALGATRKRSVISAERFFSRGGAFQVVHLRDGEAILPHLSEFFAQHIARWASTAHPSGFLDPRRRAFIERLTFVAAHTGWLRFTRLDWEARPIAFHYGFCYCGRYVYEIPTFAIDLARHSPGQVLLRQLLLLAIDECAHTFDLGIGEQEYKYRFATHVHQVRTWGLYPISRSAGRGREQAYARH